MPGQRPWGRAVESPGVLPRGETRECTWGHRKLHLCGQLPQQQLMPRGLEGSPAGHPDAAGGMRQPSTPSPWPRKGQAAGAPLPTQATTQDTAPSDARGS